MTALPGLPDSMFRMMVEQAALGIVVTDRDGRIVHVNPRQLEASGYALDELVGRNASIFGAGETPREVYETLWETLRSGRLWSGVLTNRRKSGELCRELVRIAPIRDAAGEITHFFATKEEDLFGNVQKLLAGTVATVDPLTGLPNRAMLLDRIATVLHEENDAGTGCAVASIDIDDFFAIKESFGDAAGDDLLISIAARLTECVRQSDTLARVGASHFAALLRSDDDETCLQELAQRLLAALALPFCLQGHGVAVTVSIGIARFPLDGREPLVLLEHADAAVATVKSRGGDGLHFYAPPDAVLATDRVDLGRALREATRRGELILEYQPKVDLRSGKIVGLEALVRWRHPQHGLLAPARFIRMAEESGQIVALSQWAIRTALHQLRAWLDAGRAPVAIAVNLSLRHFRFGDLPGFIAAELASSGVDPGLLELEISESAMMRDPSRAFLIVDRIKSLGVSLALDDFGTGLSSLSYLSRMKVDKLKIDKSFIRDIATNPVNASIVSAIIAIAHKLGKRVIAVGVETEGQAMRLRRHECDEIQGFHVGRPCSADEAESLLAGNRSVRLGADPRMLAGERTLLLVDDEPSILSALRRLLRREGYTILTAESGLAALELLALHPVQVIVSDQRMPGMSGIELLSRVRELYPETRRIILSGYADIGMLTDAINRGAVWKYVAKPWDDEALRAEIGQAFEISA